MFGLLPYHTSAIKELYNKHIILENSYNLLKVENNIMETSYNLLNSRLSLIESLLN